MHIIHVGINEDFFEEMELDFENLLDHLENDANYQPFPSMMHAVLFMLVNSPRPIVCVTCIFVLLLILY